MKVKVTIKRIRDATLVCTFEIPIDKEEEISIAQSVFDLILRQAYVAVVEKAGE